MNVALACGHGSIGLSSALSALIAWTHASAHPLQMQTRWADLANAPTTALERSQNAQ